MSSIDGTRRQAVIGAKALALVALVAFAGVCSGAESRAPLPPPRPDFGASTPVQTPDKGRASPPAPTVEPQAPLDPDHPPMLPPASREKMRECGRTWEAMKKAGKDRNRIWRDFATDCLAR